MRQPSKSYTQGVSTSKGANYYIYFSINN